MFGCGYEITSLSSGKYLCSSTNLSTCWCFSLQHYKVSCDSWRPIRCAPEPASCDVFSLLPFSFSYPTPSRFSLFSYLTPFCLCCSISPLPLGLVSHMFFPLILLMVVVVVYVLWYFISEIRVMKWSSSYHTQGRLDRPIQMFSYLYYSRGWFRSFVLFSYPFRPTAPFLFSTFWVSSEAPTGFGGVFN